jgi:hypothetical protein
VFEEELDRPVGRFKMKVHGQKPGSVLSSAVAMPKSAAALPLWLLAQVA